MTFRVIVVIGLPLFDGPYFNSYQWPVITTILSSTLSEVADILDICSIRHCL